MEDLEKTECVLELCDDLGRLFNDRIAELKRHEGSLTNAHSVIHSFILYRNMLSQIMDKLQ